MHNFIYLQMVEDVYLLQEGKNLMNACISKLWSQRTCFKLSHINVIRTEPENVLQINGFFARIHTGGSSLLNRKEEVRYE